MAEVYTIIIRLYGHPEPAISIANIFQQVLKHASQPPALSGVTKRSRRPTLPCVRYGVKAYAAKNGAMIYIYIYIYMHGEPLIQLSITTGNRWLYYALRYQSVLANQLPLPQSL